MHVFELSSNQQRWFEQNVKDYKKNVAYKAKKIVMMISEDSSPTFISFTIIGNGSCSQLIECNKGLLWNKLDIQESKEFSSHSNNLSIIPDRIFDGYKEHIKGLYNILSGNPPTYNS